MFPKHQHIYITYTLNQKSKPPPPLAFFHISQKYFTDFYHSTVMDKEFSYAENER